MSTNTLEIIPEKTIATISSRKKFSTEEHVQEISIVETSKTEAVKLSKSEVSGVERDNKRRRVRQQVNGNQRRDII